MGRWFGPQTGDCACCVANEECTRCSGGVAPHYLQVVISGMADRSPCTGCSALDGTYILEWGGLVSGNCTWNLTFSKVIDCAGAGSITYDKVSVVISAPSILGSFHSTASGQLHQWQKMTSNEDCLAFLNYDLPHIADTLSLCTSAAATFKITSA